MSTTLPDRQTESTGGFHDSLSSKLVINSALYQKDYFLNKFITVIGKGGCGKTTFVINKIYQNIQDSIDELFVVSDYYSCTDVTQNCLYNSITDTIYHNKNIKSICKHIKNQQSGKKHMIIIDELFSKNIELDELCIINKSLNVTLVVVSQYMMLSPNIRANIDIVMVGKMDDISDMKRIRENFFGMKSFEEFKCINNQLCPRTFLHLNRKEINSKLLVDFLIIDKQINLKKISNTFDIKNQNDNKEQINEILNEVNQMINQLVNIRNKLKNL